jgi:AraC-like DNA-binding protein
MEFTYLLPPSNIARAVKAVWIARGTKAEFEHSDPIVPDGCVEMVFNFADPFRDGSNGALQPHDLLVGQMTRPTVAIPTGDVDLLGIRFWPGRAGAVLRSPMWDLQDRMARVSDLLAGTNTWIDEIRTRPASDRVTMMATCLSRHCDRLDPSRLRLVEGALTQIARRRGNVSIADISREAGVSRRHLERQFRDQVGLPAKQVARIARVHAALHLAETEQDSVGAEIALRCGFADQPHMIKECRAIAGVTPARLLSCGTSWSSLMRDGPGHRSRNKT